MVKPFHFARLPEILFRYGSINELPSVILKYGHPVIIVTGKKSFTGSAKGKELFRLLEAKKIIYHVVIIPGEPTPSIVDEAVNTYRGKGIKLIVGIGGGSAIDAGKALSAMLTVPGSVKEYLEGVGNREHPGTKIPFIAIPTTSGTGSEATKNAVISEVGPEGFKKSLRHNHFVPDMAILDPGLTIECPSSITALSGMDCFTQLTEAFLSGKSSVFTDSFAWQGLKAIQTSLLKSYLDGSDIEARSGMSLAALCSGICLANAGLGTVHGFASSIGGKLDIPHGLVCGTLMAAANRVTVRELRKSTQDHPSLKKYAALGKLFLGQEGKTDSFYIDGFIEYLYELTDELNLPGLSGFGLEDKDIDILCAQTENKNNPVELNKEALLEVLRERML